jgi:hypothetical protein
MKATHTCKLAIPSLPTEALDAHMFPHLARPLISIGQLCDANCIASFSKQKLIITRNNEVLLSTPRDTTSGLWTIPLHQQQSADSAYHTTTQSEHMQFQHACSGYPVKSTWTMAINNGNYMTPAKINSNNYGPHAPTTPKHQINKTSPTTTNRDLEQQ